MNQVFPHKIKNPVLDRSISTVEKDCIHESVSVIEGFGRGHINHGKGISITVAGRSILYQKKVLS